MLIEMYGEQWLKDMKAKGHYGGDWPEEMIGKPKEGPSGWLKKDGTIDYVTETVKLNTLDDLKKYSD